MAYMCGLAPASASVKSPALCISTVPCANCAPPHLLPSHPISFHPSGPRMADVAWLRCPHAHRHHHLSPPADCHTPLVPRTLDLPGKLRVPIHVCGTDPRLGMMRPQEQVKGLSPVAPCELGPPSTALTATYAHPVVPVSCPWCIECTAFGHEPLTVPLGDDKGPKTVAHW